MRVHGSCEPAFAAVGEAFERGFAERGELGAAVAVHLNGRARRRSLGRDWPIPRPARRGRRTRSPTPTRSRSRSWPRARSSSPSAASSTWTRRSRGYWPEYAQAGKEATLVRHLLAHQTGILALREPQPAGGAPRLGPPDRPARRGAAALGAGNEARRGGRLLRPSRRRGRPPRRRAQRRPLPRRGGRSARGSSTSTSASAPAEQARAARLVDPGGAWRQSVRDDPRRWIEASLDNPPGMLDVDVVNSAAYRAAEIPAVNGHGTARAIARFYGGLAAGGRAGRRQAPAARDSWTRPSGRRRAAATSCSRTTRSGASASGSTTASRSASAASAASPATASAARASRSASATSRCLLAGGDRTEACEDALEEALARARAARRSASSSPAPSPRSAHGPKNATVASAPVGKRSSASPRPGEREGERVQRRVVADDEDGADRVVDLAQARDQPVEARRRRARPRAPTSTSPGSTGRSAASVCRVRSAVEQSTSSGAIPSLRMCSAIRAAAFSPRGASGRSWSGRPSSSQLDLAWRRM